MLAFSQITRNKLNPETWHATGAHLGLHMPSLKNNQLDCDELYFSKIPSEPTLLGWTHTAICFGLNCTQQSITTFNGSAAAKKNLPIFVAIREPSPRTTGLVEYEGKQCRAHCSLPGENKKGESRGKELWQGKETV